jgi:hypothetical protein
MPVCLKSQSPGGGSNDSRNFDRSRTVGGSNHSRNNSLRVGQMIPGTGGSDHSRNPWVRPFPEGWVKGVRNIQMKEFHFPNHFLLYLAC